MRRGVHVSNAPSVERPAHSRTKREASASHGLTIRLLPVVLISTHNAHLTFTTSSHSPSILVLVGAYQPVGVEMVMDANIRVMLDKENIIDQC